MARIVVVTHRYDQFSHKPHFWRAATGNYLLFDVLQALRRRGHSWRCVAGPYPLRGDIAILHVDNTHVADEYLALAAHYPATLNFATADISKRRVSGALLCRGDNWSGPVIIKSDLNCMGHSEERHNILAHRAGQPLPHSDTTPTGEYYVLPAAAEVPAQIWENPAYVVERFLPEPDPQGNGLRSWVFLGKAERCTRRVSSFPLVKAENSLNRTEVDVPEALRAERRRLGFDYGKFDFVMHNGVPILLDANRTPGKPPSTGAVGIARAEFLAGGLESLIASSSRQ